MTPLLTHEHANTIRLEVAALERRVEGRIGLGDPQEDARLAAALALSKRLGLLEAAVHEWAEPA